VLLTNCRTNAQRKGVYWAYSQITERQKRGHPHSHIITTYLPHDAIPKIDERARTSYTSEFFTRANASAGLGVQHRISLVESAEAVSRYVAKYMFKESMREVWPAHWHRVRYSHNWPKPPHIDAEFVVMLNRPEDWKKADRQHRQFICDNEGIFEYAKHRMENIRRRTMDVDF